MRINTLNHLITPPEEPEALGFVLTDRSVYRSSKVGTENPNKLLARTDETLSPTIDWIQTVGDKNYELSNHLGNVLQVVTDRKLAIDDGDYDPATGTYTTMTPDGDVDFYIADVVSQSDYYPFGMTMPGRNDPGSSDYRYLFNGKEHDPETYGNGNIYDYGFRIYNPRLGKFLSRDPLAASYPWYTPYQFAGNTPIMAIDLDGLEEFVVVQSGRGYTIFWNANGGETGELNTIIYINSDGEPIPDPNGNISSRPRELTETEIEMSAIKAYQSYRSETSDGITIMGETPIALNGKKIKDYKTTLISKKSSDGSNTRIGQTAFDFNSLIPKPSVENNSPNNGGRSGNTSNGPSFEEVPVVKPFDQVIHNKKTYTPGNQDYIDKETFSWTPESKAKVATRSIEIIDGAIADVLSAGGSVDRITINFHIKKSPYTEDLAKKYRLLYPDAEFEFNYIENRDFNNSLIMTGEVEGTTIIKTSGSNTGN